MPSGGVSSPMPTLILPEPSWPNSRRSSIASAFSKLANDLVPPEEGCMPSWHEEVRRRLRIPHAEQERFILSPAKRKVIRAGRRGGKTVGVARIALEGFLAGRRILYAVPTQEQVDRFWFEVKRALEPAIDAGKITKNETRHQIE